MERRELIKEAANAYVEANTRYDDAAKMADGNYTTEYVSAAALLSIAAELRAARLKARLDSYDG